MLHNTMDNTLLSLYWLVDGGATANAFPVEIESTKTIGNLRQPIKAENPNTFIGVEAKDLTLWSVSILDDDDEIIPVLLNSIIVKEKLRATRDLSDVWGNNRPKGLFTFSSSALL
jgi:hypothetical protein